MIDVAALCTLIFAATVMLGLCVCIVAVQYGKERIAQVTMTIMMLAFLLMTVGALAVDLFARR